MANFPTSLDSLSNPAADDTLAAVPHHTQHGTANDILEALEAKVGIGSTTPTLGTHLVGTATGSSAWRSGLVKDVRDFGTIGAADDATVFQAAFTWIAANGGELRIPAGDYTITSASLSIASAAKAFRIRGAGRGVTRIIRGGTSVGSVISLSASNGWEISDLSIVGGFAAYPTGANHGIVWYDCNNCRVSRVEVTDWKNSAIIGYVATPADPPVYVDNVIADCYVDGGGVANNGILFADLGDSHIIDCHAVDIGTSGSPCYALQLKNGCQDCSITGGYASGARIGIALGDFDATSVHERNRASGVTVVGCSLSGVAFGGATDDLVENIIIDMQGAGLAAIDFQTNSTGTTVRGVVVRNLASGKQAVRLRSGDTDNTVEIETIANSSGTAEIAAQFDSGALRNSVHLGRYVNPTTVASTTTLVSNSGGITNVFTYGALPRVQTATIASGAVAVTHNLIDQLRVDTEGAASSDDLDSITGGVDGQRLLVGSTANARDVTVRDNDTSGGNIALAGGSPVTLGWHGDSLELVYRSAVSLWCEVSRSGAQFVPRQLATIASGSVTLNSIMVTTLRVDTEASAASDDLDTIAGGVDGQRILVMCNSATRDVTVRDSGTSGGNISLAGDASMVLDNIADTLQLVYVESLTSWVEISRSSNGS